MKEGEEEEVEGEEGGRGFRERKWWGISEWERKWGGRLWCVLCYDLLHEGADAWEEIDRFPATLRALLRPFSCGLIADLEFKVMNYWFSFGFFFWLCLWGIQWIRGCVVWFVVRDFSGDVDLVVSCIIFGFVDVWFDFLFCFSALKFWFFWMCVNKCANIWISDVKRCFWRRLLDFGALIGFNFDDFFSSLAGKILFEN